MKRLWGTLCLTAASLVCTMVQAAPVSNDANVLQLLQAAQTVPVVTQQVGGTARHEIQLVGHCGRGYRGGHHHHGGYYGGYRGGYYNSYRPSYGYGPSFYGGYPGYYGGYPRSGMGLYIGF